MASIGHSGIFNIAGQELISMGGIIAQSVIASGKTPTIVKGDSPISIRNPSISKALEMLDYWTPRISIKEGIAELVEYFQKEEHAA